MSNVCENNIQLLHRLTDLCFGLCIAGSVPIESVEGQRELETLKVRGKITIIIVNNLDVFITINTKLCL